MPPKLLPHSLIKSLIEDGTLPPNGTLLQKFPDGSVAQKAVLFEEHGKLFCYACQQCLSSQDEKKVWSVKRSSVVDHLLGKTNPESKLRDQEVLKHKINVQSLEAGKRTITPTIEQAVISSTVAAAPLDGVAAKREELEQYQYDIVAFFRAVNLPTMHLDVF